MNIKHLTKEEIQRLAEERWPCNAPRGEYYNSEKAEYNKNMRRAFVDGCNISQMHYSKEILEQYKDEFGDLKQQLEEIKKKVDD